MSSSSPQFDSVVASNSSTAPTPAGPPAIPPPPPGFVLDPPQGAIPPPPPGFVLDAPQAQAPSASPSPGRFDVEGARKSGYSDDEILQHLTSTRKFDVAGAEKSGYTKPEIIQHLSSIPPPPPGFVLDAPQSSAPAKPSNTVGDFASGVWDQVNPVNAVKGAYNAIRHPIDTLTQDAVTRRQLHSRAHDDFKQGKYDSMVAHGVEGAVPLLGPALSNVGDTFQRGEWAKGLGSAMGLGASMAAPAVAGEIPLPKASWAEGAAKRLYGSALRPSVSFSPEQSARMIQTGLRERIPVSAAGLDRLDELKEGLNQKNTSMIAAAGPNRPISAGRGVQYLDDLKKSRFSQQVNPTDDLAAIDASKRDFLGQFPPDGTGTIPASQAQAMKTGTNAQLKSRAYGEQKTASVEAQKTLVRALGDELAENFPELKGNNARLGDAYTLEPALEKAVSRMGGHSLIGIGSPIVAAATKAVTGSGPVGLAAGAMRAVISHPPVASRIAIMIHRASGGQITIPAAAARVAAYANSLGATSPSRVEPPSE